MSPRWRSFGVVVASVNARVRSLLFQWRRARAPRTCAKGIFRIGGDGKVYRGVYLRLYKSCTKIFILAASTGWEAHRRRLYFPRKRGFWAEKID